MLRDDFAGRCMNASTNRVLSWLSQTGYCFPSSQIPIYADSIIYRPEIVKPLFFLGTHPL